MSAAAAPRTARNRRGVARRPTPLLALPLAGALVALPVATASAHVTVQPDTTAAGGYAVLTLRVPTESDTAGTTRLEVALPTGTPFTSVRTEPVAGWTSQVVRGALPEPVDVAGTTLTEAPLSVVWTADPGVQVGPDQFQRFALQVGPLPEEGTEVLLAATQTYSDGEVVAWDQPTPEGGEEPELPAPSFVTTAASEAGHHGAAEEEHPASSDDATSAAPDADTTARVLGGAGLLLGAGAVTVAATRGRRKES